MLVRCWIFTIALGLLTLSGQAQEQAGGTGREAERNEQPTQTLPIPIPIEIVEDEAAAEARKNSEEETRQREIDYLVIQKEMNATTQSIDAATRDMRDYALYSTVLVAIGTFMLAVTLSLTRQANKAAMRMVETQRAWMCFDNYDAHPMGSGKHATRGEYKAGYSFTPIWKNTGKYPAKILTVYTTWRWEDGTESRIFMRPDDLFTTNQGIVGPEQMIRGHQIFFLDKESERLLSQEGVAEVYGLVEYEDGFSKDIRHTEFDVKFWISGFKQDEMGRGVIYMTQTAHVGKQNNAT